MAIFGKKAEKAEGEVVKKTVSTATTLPRDLSRIILKPRITEKAMNISDKNVYTFEVAMSATKYDIRDAVKALFKVTPVKIHVVAKRPTTVMNRVRGRKVSRSGLKKAYVYLKKGDKIDLV